MPPPQGGAGRNPIISRASPGRKCPPTPAWATGFGFLSSNQEIPHNPGSHTCTHPQTPPGSAQPQHSRQEERPPRHRATATAGSGWASQGGKGQERGRTGSSLSALHRPLKSESQTYQVRLGTAGAAHASLGSPPSTYGVAEGPRYQWGSAAQSPGSTSCLAPALLPTGGVTGTERAPRCRGGRGRAPAFPPSVCPLSITTHLGSPS